MRSSLLPILSRTVLRHGDAARLGDALDPRRDIDPVAEDIVVVDDHIAKIDADAELDPPVLGNVAVPIAHLALDFGGALDRAHHAGEFDQHAVAGQFDDAALMIGDGRIDQLGAVILETRQRADLIGPHQAAVADHVGGQDRGKSAFQVREYPAASRPN